MNRIVRPESDELINSWREVRSCLERKYPFAARDSELGAYLRRAEELSERYRELTDKDGLTGLFDKVYVENELAAISSRRRRERTPVSVMLLDVDRFKEFNDNYGHLAGDHALMDVANVLTHSIREGDIVGRYGGEEFAVILPGDTTGDARHVAERIQENLRKHRVSAGGNMVAVTASQGVAGSDQVGYDHVALLSKADVALYRSKDGGRDKITYWSSKAEEEVGIGGN